MTKYWTTGNILIKMTESKIMLLASGEKIFSPVNRLHMNYDIYEADKFIN